MTESMGIASPPVGRSIAQLSADVQRAYPYRSQFLIVNARRMHYVDEGPRDGTPVLMLHGNPTWGYLWRDAIPPLLEAGLRVVVPDQVGFGLSERPHSHDVHTLDNHAANLVGLMDRLDLKRVVVVAHDWGGPTGLAATAVRPQRVAAVAVMSTWAWNSPSAEFHQRVMPWRLMHAPLVGPYLLGRRAAMPARGMHLSVVDRDNFDRHAADAYVEVVPDPDDRALTWIWPRSIPLNHPTDVTTDRFTWLEQQTRQLRIPTTIIWGTSDDVFDPEIFVPKWRELWPHAEGPHLVVGRHFLQEDSGSQIGTILADFITRTVSQAPQPS